VVVDAGRVHEYARAIGESNPAYPGSPDDTEGKIAPPTFAAVYALGVGSVSLVSRGIPPWRLIHGEQEFQWRRSVRVGEKLTSQGRIADVYQKRNLQFVIAESRVTDEAGEELCVSKTTVVVLPEGGRGEPT